MEIEKMFEQFTRSPAGGRKIFEKLSGWKTACAVFLLCAATASVASAQTFTTLVTFDGTDGAWPYYESLVQGRDGNFYGTTSSGGASPICVVSGMQGCGTVFRIAPSGALTTLYSFCSQSGCTDGAFPWAGLVLATDGNFYGTTYAGGASPSCVFWGAQGCGTVFRIAPSGTLTTLYSFCSQSGCTDGEWPMGALFQASDGNFYGTTNGGGGAYPYGCGTVFKITPSGKLTTLHSFSYGDGAWPYAGLVQATDGSLYGTTYAGGAYSSYGTVFRITLGGALTTLHSFNYTDGSTPQAALIQATDGNFYGTTSWGGPYDDGYAGTVFEIAPGGRLTTLYGFCVQPNCTDGANPLDGLTQGTDGNLYGTTEEGGADGFGAIFKITPGGTLTTLHSFAGPWADGAQPFGGLLQAANGTMYGTIRGGGSPCVATSCGTVFSLDMGLGPFVSFVRNSGMVGANVQILGQGFTGTTAVSFNGTPATFRILSDTFLGAIVPAGATTGYVTVTTPSGTLTSNVQFRVRP